MASAAIMARRFFIFLYLMLSCLDHGSAVSLIQEKDEKSLKICSISGGLDIARLYSSYTRRFFSGAIEDVELIREYISEAAQNGGIQGFHDIKDMARTVDWKARNLTKSAAADPQNLGYVDDRRDRRVERYVSLQNEPFAGDKAADMAMIDSASNILPWIVDRKSVEAEWWLKDHQNGRTEGPMKEMFLLNKLYVAAWIGTYGDAWLYYPPLRVYGHPLTFGDVMGADYNSHSEEFVKPNLPQNNPRRAAYFTSPYADTAIPGLSLITAQAPIYFTGLWQNYTYFHTYVASCGVDISVEAVSTLLDELEDALTENSFAFLVDVTTFHVIVISQSTVEKIYPPRTGSEESRIIYDKKTGAITSDRRNHTYLVSDTTFQPVVHLDNANWSSLQKKVVALQPGERSMSNLDITLTGAVTSTAFHVMYERWPSIADWALVLFAPEEKVNNAIHVYFVVDTITLETTKSNESSYLEFELTVFNGGTLSTSLRICRVPQWILRNSQDEEETFILAPNENTTLFFTASLHELNWGATSSFITVCLQDDDYPDCYHDQELTATLTIKIIPPEELNQIQNIRPYGYAMACLVCIVSVGWSSWTYCYSKHNVVRSAQPVFLHMLCLGTFFMGLSIIPLSIDDSFAGQRGCDIACQSFAWLMASGFSITFSALFSKIWRINQILRASRHCQKVRITARDVIIPFLVIFTLNSICLTLWTVIAPLKWVRSPVTGSSGPSEHESFGRCSHQESTFSMVCMCLILTVNFAALVLALIQLFRLHDAVGSFREEARMLAVAMTSMIQVFLTGVPILLIVTDNPSLSYLVKTTIIGIVAMSLQVFTFYPMFRTAKYAKESVPASVSYGPGNLWDDGSLSLSRGTPSLAGGPWQGRSGTTNAAQKQAGTTSLMMRDRRNTYAEGMAESVRKLRLELDFRHGDASERSHSMNANDLPSMFDDLVTPFEKSCETTLISNCRAKMNHSATFTASESFSNGALVLDDGSSSCEGV